MSGVDHLRPLIDNGGRRSYIERRRNSKIAGRIPDRRSHKERRIHYDRREVQNGRQPIRAERRALLR